MTIEAAMGEAGVLHDRVEADAVEALLAKQSGSGIDDPLPILGRLFPADPHLRLLAAPDRIYDDYHVTAIMTIVSIDNGPRLPMKDRSVGTSHHRRLQGHRRSDSDDSIVACQQDAADFFDSISQFLPSPSHPRDVQLSP